MTGREQERRRRRGEPSGGSPSRRTDRVRRSVGTIEDLIRPDPVVDDDHEARRAGRGRGGARNQRRPVASKVLSRLTTRRAALLALVVCALALSIAVPLNTYLSQRDQLQSQLVQQEALRAQESQLEQRETQLSDPAQVEAEARTRLHFVMPGETPYEVQLPTGVPTADPGTTGTKAGPTTSWYQKLWNNIVGSNG